MIARKMARRFAFFCVVPMYASAAGIIPYQIKKLGDSIRNDDADLKGNILHICKPEYESLKTCEISIQKFEKLEAEAKEFNATKGKGDVYGLIELESLNALLKFFDRVNGGWVRKFFNESPQTPKSTKPPNSDSMVVSGAVDAAKITPPAWMALQRRTGNSPVESTFGAAMRKEANISPDAFDPKSEHLNAAALEKAQRESDAFNSKLAGVIQSSIESDTAGPSPTALPAGDRGANSKLVSMTGGVQPPADFSLDNRVGKNAYSCEKYISGLFQILERHGGVKVELNSKADFEVNSYTQLTQLNWAKKYPPCSDKIEQMESAVRAGLQSDQAGFSVRGGGDFSPSPHSLNAQLIEKEIFSYTNEAANPGPIKPPTAQAGVCEKLLNEEERTQAKVNARPVPEGATPGLMRLMWFASRQIAIIDSNCPSEPEYRYMKSKFQKIYDQSKKACEQLSTGECQPNPY